jgi:hypothetical protein
MVSAFVASFWSMSRSFDDMSRVTGHAACSPNAAVQFDDVRRTSLLMKAVYVLRREG